MKNFRHAALAWLPLGIVITGLCGLVYMVVQQEYRQTWNDPQIELVEQINSNLTLGVPAMKAVNWFPSPWDLANYGVWPWAAVFDKDGKLIKSDVVLDGQPISIPKGVFDLAKQNIGKDTQVLRQNRVTWQPRDGIRSAIVVQYNEEQDMYAVSGRSLWEVEIREKMLSEMVFFAWLLLLVSTFVVQLWGTYLLRKR